MKPVDNIPDSQLNAFIDNELHDNDRVQVINAINADKDIAQRVNDIRQDMDLLKLAYNKPPLPSAKAGVASSTGISRLPAALVASIMLLVGVTSGLFIANQYQKTSSPAFTNLADYNPADSDNRKILVHVSSLDKNKIDSALDKLDEILQYAEQSDKNIDLVLIANEAGLGMLRKESPYTDRIHSLSRQHKNVEFLACGIAMEMARLKEGDEIELLEEAEKIPAALTDILDRLKDGWLYIKP